jgi:hypothetical protein
MQVWLIRIGAVLGVVALLALSAPLIWAAVSAGVGVAALAAMGAVGFTCLQLVPLGMQKLENKVLALRKAEARQNPIEQLQNDCIKREERLQSFRRALFTTGGQIESMGQMVDDRRHTDPGHILDWQTGVCPANPMARALQSLIRGGVEIVPPTSRDLRVLDDRWR